MDDNKNKYSYGYTGDSPPENGNTGQPSGHPENTPPGDGYSYSYTYSYPNNPAPIPPPIKPPDHNLAIASLVLAILSFPLSFCCIGWILAIIALVFSLIARSHGNRSGICTAGLILSSAYLALFIFYIIFSALSFSTGMKDLSSYFSEYRKLYDL